MGNIYTLNKGLDQVLELYNEGYTVEEAIRRVKEKGYEDSYHTNPSIQYKNVKDIIPPCTDLDNGEVFDLKSGQTIRDL